MAVIRFIKIGSKTYEISVPANLFGSGFSFDTGNNRISLKISKNGPFTFDKNGTLDLLGVLNSGYMNDGVEVKIKRTAPLWFNQYYAPEKGEFDKMFSSGLSLPFNMFSGLDVNEQGLAVKASMPFSFGSIDGSLELKFNSQDFRINDSGELELVK